MAVAKQDAWTDRGPYGVFVPQKPHMRTTTLYALQVNARATAERILRRLVEQGERGPSRKDEEND